MKTTIKKQLAMGNKQLATQPKKHRHCEGAARSNLIHFSLILLTFNFMNFITNCLAQNTYQTDTYEAPCAMELIKTDADAQKRMAEIEQQTQEWIKQNEYKKTSAIITIPVVVHIVWRTAEGNISDAVVQKQIDILNKDYRRQNADASNTPSAFKSVAADCEIEFRLVTRDPDGKTTNGITRTQTTVSSIGNWVDKKYSISSEGGHDAWNTDAYLNIWVCEVAGGMTGFGWYAGQSLPSYDGVIMDYLYFGLDITTLNSRSTTHEVGHYLNLYHPWGKTDKECSEDDMVADTPPQYKSSFGTECSVFPYTDECTKTSPGIMFMNFMDYGRCKNMFTQGQKTRILATLNGIRKGLVSGSTSIKNISANKMSVTIFPSPSSGNFELIINNTYKNVDIEVYNIFGKIVYTNKNITINNKIPIDLSQQAKGVYFIKIKSNDEITVNKIIIL